MISIIAAVAENNIIGRNNELPWNLSEDLKYFSKTTKGHTVLMGITTFHSIVKKLGHPLPNRKNIVMTFEVDKNLKDCVQVTSWDSAFKEIGNEDVFIIGGASIYKQAIDFADKLYITRVHSNVDGDTSFPEIKESVWKIVSAESHKKDTRNDYDYTFQVYERKK